MRFKVGDKVKVVDAQAPGDAPVGSVLTITEVDGSGLPYRAVTEDDGHVEWYFDNQLAPHVPEPAQEVRELALCEAARIIPVPGALYRFTQTGECFACKQLAARITE